jgi:uncharacterized protein YbjT (DUF2867 family)
MKKILVIGATGQLGSAVVKSFSETGSYHLRVLVRPDANYQHLEACQPGFVQGDLTHKESLRGIADGCDVIIATANTMVPRKKGDSFRRVDTQGYRDLID